MDNYRPYVVQLLPFTPSEAPLGLWTPDECADRCSYRLDAVEHLHELHDDGSRAVMGMGPSGAWELLEFQGSLGF